MARQETTKLTLGRFSLDDITKIIGNENPDYDALWKTDFYFRLGIEDKEYTTRQINPSGNGSQGKTWIEYHSNENFHWWLKPDAPVEVKITILQRVDTENEVVSVGSITFPAGKKTSDEKKTSYGCELNDPESGDTIGSFKVERVLEYEPACIDENCALALRHIAHAPGTCPPCYPALIKKGFNAGNYSKEKVEEIGHKWSNENQCFSNDTPRWPDGAMMAFIHEQHSATLVTRDEVPHPVAYAALTADAAEIKRAASVDGVDINSKFTVGSNQWDGVCHCHRENTHSPYGPCHCNRKTELGAADFGNQKDVTPFVFIMSLKNGPFLANSITCQALIDAKADVNATCGAGATALHKTAGKAGWAGYGDQDAIRMLLKFKPNLNLQLTDSWHEYGAGSTPLHIAVREGRQHTVRMLVEAGADRHVKDASGKTPIDYLASARVQREASRGEIEEQLKKFRFDDTCVVC